MRKFIMTLVIGIVMSNPNWAWQSQRPQNSELQQLLDSISLVLEEHKVPGAGIALVHKDSIIWAGGLGKANLEQGTDVNAHSIFKVGSITKSFIALGILRLVEEGRLKLDDKLVDIIPEIEFKNGWSDTDPLRLYHLLEHTAGFDDMRFNEMINATGRTLSAQEALAINPKSRTVRWRPGTRISYSNPGYAMAGYILEKFSGTRFEDYLKEVTLIPMDMQDASFEDVGLPSNHLVQGYKVEADEIVEEQTPEVVFRWAGSLNASVSDLSNLIRFFLNRGVFNGEQLWKETSIDRMERVTSTLAAKNGLNLGYGLANTSTVRGKYRQNGHSGGINGFISRYRYIRKADVGYVVLLNSVSATAYNRISDLLANYLTKGLEASDIESGRKAKDYADFTGYYKHASPRNQIFAGINSLTSGLKVFESNDSLFVKRFMQEPQAVISMGGNTFRYENYNSEHLIFAKDPDGKMTFIDADGLGDYFEKSSALGHTILLIMTVVSIILLIAFVPIWLIRRAYYLLKKKNYPSRSLNEVMMFLVPVFFILAVSGISNLTLSDVMMLGSMNKNTVGFFLITLGLGVFMIGAIILTIRKFRHLKGVWKYYLMALCLANLVLLILFYQWDLIGLRTWAW